MDHQGITSNNFMTSGLNTSSGASSSSNQEPKGHTLSHNRNVSLDSSLSRIKGKGLNINFYPLNNENSSVLSVSSGTHAVIGTTDEALNIGNVSLSSSASKGNPISRGSSPASKKKHMSETSGGLTSSGRRRSPLSVRKNPVAGGEGSSFTTPPSNRARFPSNHEDEQVSMDNRDLEGRALSSMFNGSGDAFLGAEGSFTTYRFGADDDVDSPSFVSTPSQQQKTKEVLELLQTKIQRTTELITEEQIARDENVNEYLKLSTNADGQQLARIKTVFEKKNQKSAANIQHLQKKLDNYKRRKKEVEQRGITLSHRQPKEVLREVGYGLKSVGDNIRDGFSGFSGKKGLIGKPKEIAHLIKNKFGSADNIKELGEEEKDEERNHHGSATLPPNSGLHPTTSSIALASKAPVGSGTMGSSGGGGSGGGGGSSGGGKAGSEEGSERSNSSITSESISGGGINIPLVSYVSPQNHHGISGVEVPVGDMDTIYQELKERQEENTKLREEIEIIKSTLTTELNQIYENLHAAKERCNGLEEQVNDLIELHQNEMENLKTAMKDLENMGEKFQYKNEENIRDLHEMVESFQAKINRMEQQQAHQQQQFLTLEGLENSNARMLFVKLINILLTVLQVLLLVVATIAGILTPLLQTKTRLVTTATLCLFTLFVYLQLTEIRESWQVFLTRVAEFLS